MSERILVTGSAGLIGTSLCRALRRRGVDVLEIDLRKPGKGERGDIADVQHVSTALRQCAGVVHLAAIARVALCEADPRSCWSTNVDGTQTVLRAAERTGAWFLFASSREVYGATTQRVVSEASPICPINAYGRSKAAAEELVERSRSAGHAAAIVRLANVYGSIEDYSDRVVPAFVQRAVAQQPLLVEGEDRYVDFTHVDDVVEGLMLVIDELRSGLSASPVQLVSGTATTLGELARMVVDIARSSSAIQHAPPRAYAVPGFCGDGTLARTRLGWSSRVSLRDGVARMVLDMSRTAAALTEVAS
ncbi:MAG: NAD-dependent epimerase/dehydratase family protein [Myxococcales bacterium]|nr:NAD-dependent epimerase/dehydratase family protein [Myxococcales bacterium]